MQVIPPQEQEDPDYSAIKVLVRRPRTEEPTEQTFTAVIELVDRSIAGQASSVIICNEDESVAEEKVFEDAVIAAIKHAKVAAENVPFKVSMQQVVGGVATPIELDEDLTNDEDLLELFSKGMKAYFARSSTNNTAV
jgi:hypothetical protein